MKNASCRWTEVIRWKLTNFMIFLGFRGFRPLFQGMTPLYRMQFSKYSNSKAWFQILSLSHWSIQFDFLPKLTHKSVALISKITVCFGSPCIKVLEHFKGLSNFIGKIWLQLVPYLQIIKNTHPHRYKGLSWYNLEAPSNF